MASATFKRDPKFGWDPWLGPGTPPSEAGFNVEEIAAAAKVYSGQDTLAGDINLLVPGLDMYGSYVDNFGGYTELVARFRKSGAFLLSITIFGNHARCADVEPGAMHASDLAHWLDSVGIKDPESPCWVYTSASNMAACNAVIGSRHVIRWSAHYGFGPHVCGPNTCGYPQADWTQWTDTGPNGENYDRSVGLVLPQKTQPDTLHYDRYDAKRRIVFGGASERSTVEEYDKLRATQTNTNHPHRARLAVLRARCAAGAVRLAALGSPDKFNRAFRRAGLAARAKGQRLN